jgi:hypothetical protein
MSTIKATGILRHHFWGDYSAGMALQFSSEQDAADALEVLSSDWKHGQDHRDILVWCGTGRQLEEVKKIFQSRGILTIKPCGWSHCEDQCAGQEIDSIRHSIDAGPGFELELRVSNKNQMSLFGG